ncbi:MAG: acyl carrier protein [Deltaproteobacteria bacterium]|nr:acyl carrier protein [Deltaproteobacteria bacterium]
MASMHDELRAVIAEIGEIDDPARITDDADLYADLGIDSMQALEIVLEMEKRFDLQVPEDALRDIRSLADAVRLVERLGSAKKG